MGQVDRIALQRVMADYATAMVQGPGDNILELLYELTDHCVGVLGLAGAGLVLRNESGWLYFVTATDGRASRLENVQLSQGDGPCYLAYRTGKVVTVSDIEDDDRWPQYRQACADVGYRAVAGVPMPVDGETEGPMGALNLYDTEPREWSADEVDVASLLSNLATGYLLTQRTLATSTQLNDQLQHALDARVVVEQAKGMLAADRGIDVDSAFELLRDHARSHGRRVRDVARAILDGEALPDVATRE